MTLTSLYISCLSLLVDNQFLIPSKETPKSKPKATPGKRARNAPNVAQELKDCHQQTANGKPICWAYNLPSGCKSSAGVNPPACSRGAHVCASCRRVGHSYPQCKNAQGGKDDGNPKN